MKFTRLARSQQWTEDEQHDHFCFSLEGADSEYYTLLLETSPDLSLDDILARFEKRFGSSAPDITHQLNFQSATQFSGETLRQWANRILALATRAFPTLADVHPQAVTWLCYGAEDQDAGLYALHGHPKTVEEAVDRMQYYQHSCQGRPSKSKVRQVEARSRESPPERDSRNDLKELLEQVHNMVSDLRDIKHASPALRSALPRPKDTTPERTPPSCYLCGEPGQFRRDCPNARKSDTQRELHTSSSGNRYSWEGPAAKSSPQGSSGSTDKSGNHRASAGQEKSSRRQEVGPDAIT
jgi:hypothetical protein